MTCFATKFNENATMSFMVNNNKQPLEHYKKIREKTEKLTKINLESKPVYDDNDKYIRTKIKTYADSMVTSFHNKKTPKEKHHASVCQ